MPLDSAKAQKKGSCLPMLRKSVCPLALSSQVSEQKKRLITRVVQAWRIETHTHTHTHTVHKPPLLQTHTSLEKKTAPRKADSSHTQGYFWYRPVVFLNCLGRPGIA